MNTLYSSIAIGVGAVGGWIATVIASAFVTVPPVRMNLEYLRFQDGNFYQHVSVSGSDAVYAEWSARIWRDDGTIRTLLCSGGGSFPYDGLPSRAMSPDYWTDSKCPELQTGDEAIAVWEYTDEADLRRRFSAELTIP